MARLASHFIIDQNRLIPANKYIVRGQTYRFTILTPRLIRLEYNKNGIFEDRGTSLVVNRTFNDVSFTITPDENNLIITTEYFTLKYAKEKPLSPTTIKVKVNGTDKEWTPGYKSFRNFGGLSYSLDDLNEKFKLSKGLYSLDGFVTIDDSKNYVLENDNFIQREEQTLDLYLFVYGNDLGLCLQDYFNLTGYPPMIPRYALGNWWYKNDRYNMYEIDDILKKFKDVHIPISVFLLGDKWHTNTENYTYDKTLFDTNILKDYYANKSQKFGLTIDPSIKITPNDPLYNEIIKYIQETKNGLSFIPLNNNAINVYLNLIVQNLMNTGINIFNIDYNNKLDKNNLFLLNHYHYVIANIQNRGIILSRNAEIAPHRYPIIYSGKTKVSWETLNYLASYNNTAANIGVTWHAHAIGGYYGGIEDNELYLRYLQFGVFNPIFILSSDAGKYYKREPWKWNELILNVITEYMQLRNKLVPYIYNESYNYHKYGVPLIQPLYYKYPKIYDEPNYVNQYFFGSRIMISPIVKRKNKEMNRVVQRLFIPNGIWYDYFSGKKFIGNKYYMNFYKDSEYPIFIKEGSIIPMSQDFNTDCPQNMEIQIFPAENGLFGSYELYEDDGISITSGQDYLITKFNLDKIENGYKFTINPKSGQLNINNRNYLLRFRNMKTPEKVIVKYAGNEFENTHEVEKKDLIIKLENINVFSSVEIYILGQNLEIETENVINEEIEEILYDLEISTLLKYKIDSIIFSDIPIKKKRIALRKLKKDNLEPKYINMFIGLLDFIETK